MRENHSLKTLLMTLERYLVDNVFISIKFVGLYSKFVTCIYDKRT